MAFNFKELLTKNKENFQIFYGVILIVLIPLIIAFNTIFIINQYNNSFDTFLQRQALTIGRSVYVFLKGDLGNSNAIQKKIEILAEKNSEFQETEVLVPAGEDFKVIASSRKEDIGRIMKFYYYNLAWIQPDNDALATDSLLLAKSEESKDAIGEFSTEDRFWLVALPMSDAAGQKQALLTMKISSKVIDDITDYNRRMSLYLLAVTVAIVVLFLFISVRLWDYALLYKKIKEVDKMKDDFISMASHELRTPLTAIRGYLSLVLDGTYGRVENEKMREAFAIMSLSTDRLGNLVEDLLEVSRIEQGRMEINNRKTEVAPIIKEIVAQLAVSAREKNLALEYPDAEEKLPPVMADPDRLKQVLVNLIGNAIKYTQKGSVKVISRVNKNKMEIRVVDTGIGISAEEQKRLFEKFYRVKNADTRDIIGTGLGLWITKQLVELMKGEMTLESMKDVGTQITVKLNLD